MASRNNALATRQRWLIFGMLAASSLGAGGALIGIRSVPVLPWSLVEIGALAAVFWHVERQGKDGERLMVAGERARVAQELQRLLAAR